MDDPASFEDSSMTVVQSDSTIAFAYIKEVKSKKKRFFVLKSQPRASPSEFDSAGKSPSLNYFLYSYKSKKHYERGSAKRIYDLANVILLSRCTKKANKTILGVCFQEETLFLKFDTEDELSRWYFHLNEVFSAKRNCLWPELKQCFSVTLKNKDLAAAASRHGKVNLPGQYRFCLTESSVLLVKCDLLNPVLSLPFPCIRSCVHSMTSNFFQIHLGRLSPIGEGVLHFEAEQSSLLKEIIENLLRGLSEASSRDVEFVKARKNRRNSREAASSTQQLLREDYAQRPASMQYCALRHCQKCDGRVSGVSPGSGLHPTHSSSIVGLGSLVDAGRGYSLPPSDSLSQPEDYCPMDLSGDARVAAYIGSGNCGGAFVCHRSPNSSMSLSTGSELTGADSDRALSVVTSASAVAAAATAAAGSTPAVTGTRLGGQPPDDRACVSRVAPWRYDSVDSSASGGSCGSSRPPSAAASALAATASGSPVTRANSIGSRQAAQQLHHQYHPASSVARISSHQVFVELSFPRPRTTSDAASHHYHHNFEVHGYSTSGSSSYASSSRSFRPRARSYGTKFGRSLDAAAAAATAAEPALGRSDSAAAAVAASPSLSAGGGSVGMRPLSESTATSASFEHQMMLHSVLEVAVAPAATAAADEGSYVTMVLRPALRSCVRDCTEDGGVRGDEVDERSEDAGEKEEEEEEFDPYWMPPGRLDALVDPRTYGASASASASATAAAVADSATRNTGGSPPAGKRVGGGGDGDGEGDDYFMMDLPAPS